MSGGMRSPVRPGRLPLSARPVVPPPGGPADGWLAARTPSFPGPGRVPTRTASASTGTAGPSTAAGRTSAAVGGVPSAGVVPRHCWVVDSQLAPGRCPGVLLEWQRTPHGWRGRVVLAVPGEGGAVLMEAWLPAGLLRPADT